MQVEHSARARTDRRGHYLKQMEDVARVSVALLWDFKESFFLFIPILCILSC